MAFGINPMQETQINKSFSYILRNSPNFIYARTTYDKLKCKDLTKCGCEGDLIKKADVIKEFQAITKIDTISKKAQAKWGERAAYGSKFKKSDHDLKY